MLSIGLGKVEVVASRRQQKQAQAAADMPPPPAKLVKQPAALSSNALAPTWAGKPPPGYYLEVQKSGEPVQQIELNSPCTLFGRLCTHAGYLYSITMLLMTDETACDAEVQMQMLSWIMRQYLGSMPLYAIDKRAVHGS